MATNDTTPRVVLPIFEGPLDLLLHLVKVNEMDIHEIEISTITRQYLEYLAALQEINLELAGDFLVMAATLLNIKSRSLLPRPPGDTSASPEEEIDEVLSTQDLIRRLVEFRRFKEISSRLRQLEEENDGVYSRATVVPVIPGSEQELPRQDIVALFDAFARVLTRVRHQPSHTVIAERFTVEAKVDEVRELIRSGQTVNFARVFAACVVKEEAICYFLAILEMARLREITVVQSDNFEDILVAAWAHTEAPTTP